MRFFKSDLQGKCDSLTYATLDSAFRMYFDPIVWSDSSQVTGDTIFLTLRDEMLDSLKVYSNSFILSQNNEGLHNQIKGRRLYGKFKQNDLRKVLVNGNGQTIYYPRDEKDGLIGMNRAICSNIIILLKDNEVSAITFLTKPEAKLYPMSEAKGEVTRLEGFDPRFTERPTSKKDLLQQ
ncbi:MAG: hypothetical protein U5L96_21005 [Owenweeksia sp.]|nr:hypothetical protein [Owenweeksia sp.]